MNGRLLFSGLGLEFVAAFGPLFVLFLATILDYTTIGQLYLFIAEASVVLAAAGLVLVVLGAVRRGSVTHADSLVLVVLSAIAFFGTIVSAWWTLGAASWASMDCGPSTVFKCDMVQAGTYVSFYFFPAIAIPVVTFVFGLANTVELERLHSATNTA